MAKLFISYRRKAWPFARSLADGLQAKINAEVFVDVDGINDDDFETSLIGNLVTSDAVLLIVSPETFDPERIHSEGDWVRREVGRALSLDKPILLAGLNGLTPPPPDQLPEDIRRITQKESISIYSEFFEEGVERIVSLLVQISPIETRATMLNRRQKQRRRIIAGLIALIALLLIISVALLNYLPSTQPAIARRSIPAGCFRMGSTEDQVNASIEIANRFKDVTPADQYKSEQPQHTVCVGAFQVDESEVTNEAFQRFIDAGGYTTRSWWTEEGWAWLQLNKSIAPNLSPVCRVASQMPKQPRVCVNYYEAQAYAKWAGGRLPTEAEWEYVARGTDSRMFPWGNSFDSQRLNYCDRNCPENHKDSFNDAYGYTAPVCSYPSGNSSFGACDMAGNVWEWVADWYQIDYYQTRPNEEHDPKGPTSGVSRVLRGGSFDNLPSVVRSAFRSADAPDRQSPSLGFRTVKDGSR